MFVAMCSFLLLFRHTCYIRIYIERRKIIIFTHTKTEKNSSVSNFIIFFFFLNVPVLQKAHLCPVPSITVEMKIKYCKTSVNCPSPLADNFLGCHENAVPCITKLSSLIRTLPISDTNTLKSG